MPLPSTCTICQGAIELRYPGTQDAPQAGDFSPTCHRPGAYGDLYVCRECGTVQQPSLPGGDDLGDLYREMDDTGYLAEEQGRRATANWLLDSIERRRGPGRMLEIGCGHGLLLDEARRRGWETRGLELSESSAHHARDVLGLDVREQRLETLGADERGRWDAVLMVDVIEHLDDPVDALNRCRDLLAPGGVLCVVTPDPSSPTARAAGARWWGYLPAHTYLIPRTTLRELIIGSGLVLADDIPLVRTFSARYWMAGLAERGGTVGNVVRQVQARTPEHRSLSLSLGDERVMIAVNERVRTPDAPLAHDRGGDAKVHVVLPAYHAAQTVALVAADLPVEAFDRALLVDDASDDDTVEASLAEGFEVLRHPANRGYGANQKTCYTRAALDGADVVVMVHPDHQYDAALVAEMVQPILDGRADVVMGSRLLEDRAIAGGMPRWKWVGNRGLTWAENRAFRKELSEYHTGYRAFSVEFLRTIPFLRNSDGFVFDQEIFAQIVDRGARIVELPIPTRYFLEASSVSFRASVRYGLETLGVLARYRVDEKRRRWSLLRRPATTLTDPHAPAPVEAEPTVTG
jgi:SAM-dependent methyltransferase